VEFSLVLFTYDYDNTKKSFAYETKVLYFCLGAMYFSTHCVHHSKKLHDA